MADAHRFYEMSDQFFRLYEQGAYQQAVELLEQQAGSYPENEVMILAWKSAMLARLGRTFEAVSCLRQAYDRGYWYHEAALSQDPDFAALQGDARFKEVVELHAMRRLVETPRIRPALSVISPAGSGPFPALIVLHGGQSNITNTVEFWKSVVDQGWLLALPQSTQPTWASSYASWDDSQRALAEIHGHLADVTQRYPIKKECMVAGGFSQGAQIALRMALNPDFHLRGAVVAEGWFTEEVLAEMVQLIKQVPQSAVRIYLTAGKENTEFYHMAEEIFQLLSARDIPCFLEAGTNTRHHIPVDFDQVLQRALRFICAG